jgi:hypothetical protein
VRLFFVETVEALGTLAEGFLLPVHGLTAGGDL